GVVTPSSMLDGTRVPPQAETPKPILSPETRGDILMARKEYRQAIEAFAEGSPKDAVLRNKTGIAYHQLQQLDNARKCYELAVKLKPDYHEAINNLGTIWYAKKSYRRAVSQYKKAIKISPDSASIHSNLGTAYFARKEFESAMEEFRTALQLDPNVFEHHSSYGIMLQERSVQDRAKFHYSMAALYAQGGRSELAIQYLRKALEEGFKERKKLDSDPAFATLRELPEFKLLLTLEPRVL
ncbi:MAG: Tetratricopeptide 2 repeat protein, partial [Candidatus Solibacter sp.]|nr:Tetratricopeptide 2 repeat protein [Candidatus Solibacter sp.]